MNKLFLIDAYALIYRSYYALIRSPRINSKGLNTSAIMGFVNTLWEVLQKEKPTHLAVAFDHGRTFRHEAYPEYKAQREETPEDIRLSIPIIKDILTAWRIPILQIDGFEADDIIGAVAREAEKSDFEVFMLTPDKDYGQLTTERIRMYKPRHGGGYDVLGEHEICEKYTISSAKQVIDILALMGDSADNFPGCPGVGEKTAIKLVNEFGSCEHLIDCALGTAADVADHQKTLKGALLNKVRDHVEDIRISKFLARICTDIPAVNSNTTLLHDMEVQDPDAEALSRIFDDLEFRQLAKKILGKSAAIAAGPDPDELVDVIVEVEEEERQLTGYNLFGEAEYKVVKVKKTTTIQKKRSDLKKTDIVKEREQSQKSVQNYSQINASDAGEWSENENDGLNFGLESVTHDYQLIDNEADAKNNCEYLLTKKILCFDTETTSKSAIDARLVGFSLCAEKNKAWYVCGEFVEIYRPLFESDDIVKIGQNIKYDIEVLRNSGINVRGTLRDTMIAHYLLQPELRHGMDYMAETLLGGYQTIHYDDIVPKGKTMADLYPTDIKDYACEDADVTWQLWQVLEPKLREVDGLWRLFEDIEMPLVEVLADIEMTGVSINTETMAEVSQLFTERMNTHEKNIYRLANQEFNISSPKQVGEVLFDKMKIIDKPKKTKTGQYVTSEEVLQSLAKDHEIVSEILAYRGLKKLIGTYVDALPKLVNPRTGRIHTSFNQCVTATGRLSSSDPNLQNIPIRDDDGKEIRRCFVANDGNLFFSADYSQIELRVMAHLSQDTAMIEAFRNAWDIHASTAANVYHKERQDVTRDERTKAKRANFGIIYGISAWGLSQSLEIDRKEAKALMDGFFETFPRVKEYMQQSIDIVKAEASARQERHNGDSRYNYGYARTLMQRRRKLVNINSSNGTVRSFDERNAINAPIQGTAADIIKIAMVQIFRRFRAEGLRSKMILQVHDELNFSVVPDEKDRVEQIVIEEMQNAYPLDVPLVAECGWGNNWLEAH